jgi:hypothetical protein
MCQAFSTPPNQTIRTRLHTADDSCSHPSLRLKLKTEERGLGNSLGISALRHRKVGAIHLSS